MTNTAEPLCYVMRTPFHGETKAASHLLRQGYGVYPPCYVKKRRIARRFETVVAPLFPRSLFVVTDLLPQLWRSIQSTIGGVHLICTGGEPSWVPPSVIAELRSRESEDGFIRLNRCTHFVSGESVQVADGIFAARLDLFEQMTDGNRVAILLDLLGRKIRVVMDRDAIAAT